MLVTLLSIFASHGIALPLSAAFPPNELQYILEQSEASMLLASEKFQDKAKEVLEGDLKTEPRYVKLEKAVEREDHEKVELEGSVEGKGGMMLYTSGTTSRPVRFPFDLKNRLLMGTERCIASPVGAYRTVPIAEHSMGVQPQRSRTACSTPPSYSRNSQCDPRASIRWIQH